MALVSLLGKCTALYFGGYSMGLVSWPQFAIHGNLMWSLYLIVGLFGALIGSFLNVCIYRMPRRESIAWPGSHCPACSSPIAWYDNVPMLSYLALAGRCRHCAGPIPLHYPIVEALNAVGYIGLLWFFGLGWP